MNAGSIVYGSPRGANVFAPGFGGVNPLPGSVVVAAGTIQSTIVAGVVSWSFIELGGHAPVFFTAAIQSPATPSRIRITYPTVSNVITFLAVCDETYAGFFQLSGATVDLSFADIQLAAPRNFNKNIFQGNGTTWVPLQPSITATNLPGYAVSGSRLSIISTLSPVTGLDGNAFTWDARYMGSNGRFIKPTYSGLGSFNAAYDLVDASGTLQTPQSTDYMIFDAGLLLPNEINAYDPASPYNGVFGSNIWIIGLFEL